MNVKIFGIHEISLTDVEWHILDNGIEIYKPGDTLCFISEQHISSYMVKRGGIKTLIIGLKCTKKQFKIIASFLKELGGVINE